MERSNSEIYQVLKRSRPLEPDLRNATGCYRKISYPFRPRYIPGSGKPFTTSPFFIIRLPNWPKTPRIASIAACPSVLDFKIEQNTDDELVVFLLASDKQFAKAETIQTLAKLFERHNLRSPTLTIEEQPSNDPTQKRRRVVRAKNIGLPQNEFKQKGQRK